MLLIVILFSCKKENRNVGTKMDATASKKTEHGFADNDMVLYWNEKTSVLLDAPITPPAQSRYFAMVQIAIHDALNSIKPKYQRYALTNERDQFASEDAAVASAAYWTIKGMNVKAANPTYPWPVLNQLDDWYNQSLATVADGESKQAGIALGKKAANAIVAKRATDNFETANQQLPLPDGIAPGAYRSTLPFSLPNMPKIKGLHQWGALMTPFVTMSNDQFRPPAPYAVNSAEYTADYNEVKTKGARAVHTRTADEDQIGKFWVERCTIAWNRFVRNIVASKKMDAWKTARLFALLHTAMTDGASGCFEAKYHYLYWRPETAIRLGDDDGNNNTVGDANWLPSNIESPNAQNPALNVNTPPIPDYPSQHANFGGVAAQILFLFFGNDNISVDQTSLTLPGIVRHYSSISQAARDNSLSRIYVGYHFRNACLKGEEQGKQIADYIFSHSFRETGDE